MHLKNYFGLVTISTLLSPCSVLAEPLTFSVSIEADYYQCLAPNPPVACLVSSDEQKQTCPECSEWSAGFYSFSKKLELDGSAYLYGVSPGFPRASYFVRDAYEQLFLEEFPRTTGGHPITIKSLYQNPEKYGFMELNTSEPIPGTIAVWPEFGGVIVDGNGGGELLYPSHQKSGELNTLKPGVLDGVPKYLIPAQRHHSDSKVH